MEKNKWLSKIKNPYDIFLSLQRRGMLNWVPDAWYLKLMYRAKIGSKLNLIAPKTFNEKLQWLKLYDRNPKYTQLVDKCEAKKQVANIIGEEYIVPTLGVWDKFDDINFDDLPNQFVLKCTHDSGGVYIVLDKGKMDKEECKRKLEAHLQKNFYYSVREWPYKNIKPRIIAEKLLVDNEIEIKDYKMMCFNGNCKCSFVCSERFSEEGLKVTFFDREWNVMPFERHYPKSNVPIEKPKQYEKMLRLAEELAQDIPFVRVDFYEVKDKIYFGEMTFYPGSGFEEFEPVEWDLRLGSWIDIEM